MSICSSLIDCTTSLNLLPSLTSSSLQDFASPPFSSLPLTPAEPGELFAFGQLPLLFPDISWALIKPRSTGGSVSSCSSRGSISSGSMSASDSQRRSISSMASSSLRSISEGSSSQSFKIRTVASHDDLSFATARQMEPTPVKDTEWLDPQSDVMASSSLLDRIRPLVRTNTLLSQRTKIYKQEHQATISTAPIKVVVQREQTTTSQTIDRADPEYCLSHISQTAAWRMMQSDCRADQLFGDIHSILSHAPFATSCVSPTSPSYRHHEVQTFTPTRARTSQSLDLKALSNSGEKSPSSAIAFLVKRLRRKGRRESQASVSSRLSRISTGTASMASEEDLLQATRTLGLSWGCEARKIWDADHAPRHSSFLSQPEIHTRNSIDDVEVEGWTLERDESHLQQWSTFYQAYAQGQLDLSATPRIPKGVPDIEYCPNATPAGGPGHLEAPTPDWEVLRARAYCRLELDQLNKETLRTIAEKVECCSTALHVQQSLLHCLQGNTVLRMNSRGLYEEGDTRKMSLCAHTILNRNRGMTVEDIAMDWRFAQPKVASQIRYYAGMPIVAANGLPVAILSVWDAQRDFNVEPHFLKRMAREIGQVFEEHYRIRWERKICKMVTSVELLKCRLSQAVNVPWSSETEGTCTYNLDDMEALADVDIFVSIEDVTRLQSTLGEMASLLDLEMMYIAAICLDDHHSAKQNIYMLASHNLKYRCSLSFKFHQRLFFIDHSDIEQDRFYLRQNDCMSTHVKAKAVELQPVCGLDKDLEAMLILPIAERGKIAFVLGAMTQSKTKVIGIEDLRYMEALRPSLSAAIDNFIKAAQLPAPSALSLSFSAETHNPGQSATISPFQIDPVITT
jgi:hypothetical protein